MEMQLFILNDEYNNNLVSNRSLFFKFENIQYYILSFYDFSR